VGSNRPTIRIVANDDISVNRSPVAGFRRGERSDHVARFNISKELIMNTSMLAVDLAGNFEPGAAIISGLVGAVAMLAVIYGGRAMGMTSMDLLRTLGTMIVPKAASNVVYAVGLMMHLMMGAVFGVVHAGLLEAADPTTNAGVAGLGIVFGLIHGVIVTAMMPIMLMMAHPLVRGGDMPAPGTAMTGFGKMTPGGIVMAHVVFALVAGAVYVAAVG
jgi:hypothetical protein